MAKEELMSKLEKLPKQLQQVINLRYGLDSGKPLSLLEVSEIMGITRERVRQLEEKALKMMRENS